MFKNFRPFLCKINFPFYLNEPLDSPFFAFAQNLVSNEIFVYISDMSVQVALLGGAVRAVWAGIRLLPSVSPGVSAELGGIVGGVSTK